VILHSTTSIAPPRLASLPAEREQLEFSSRSLVFVEDGVRVLRAWGPPRRPWVVGVEPRGARWRVEAWGAGPKEARAAVRAMFSLEHRLEEFYRLVRKEPVLRGTERRFRGLRVPRDANLYDALIHAIVGQQLSVAAANALKRRLFERTGAFLEVDGVAVPCAPLPDRLRDLRAEGLRELGISWAKARAISHLAAETDRLELLERRLASPSADGAVEALCELPGVGRWTAENALLRGVGRTDIFVAGDLGLRVALDEYGAVPRAAPEDRARAWCERHYPGWGSYATLYLWRKLVDDRAQLTGG
jgi:3-methyladenine DNA glycosylase/8-oxoguanine DNA glycosylase